MSPRPARASRQDWTRDAERLLRDTFGLEALRTGQREVIRNVMERRDTLAVMPTGAGKSLCYQLPALMLPGRTVVVSPLIALMKDQCDKLRDAGVEAVQLNSALDADELAAAGEAVASGRARIVFTTPERLATPTFRAALAESPTSLLVIDEAHCISQWGHDFRRPSSKWARRWPRSGGPPCSRSPRRRATRSRTTSSSSSRCRRSRASAPASIGTTCATRSSRSRATTRSRPASRRWWTRRRARSSCTRRR